MRVNLTGRSQLSRKTESDWRELAEVLEQRHGLLLLEWREQLRPAIDWSQYVGQPHVFGQLLEQYRAVLEGTVSLSADQWEKLLQPDDRLQRPDSPQRQLSGEKLTAYRQRVLRQALDLLADEFVLNEAG